MKLYIKILFIFCLLIAISCRGVKSSKPPIHLLQNMDDVGRLDSQSENLAFYYVGDSIVYINENKMSMITPVEGTVSRVDGIYKASDQFIQSNNRINLGVNEKGKFIKKIPDEYIVDEKFLKRGQERYGIYCGVCHGAVGDGNGSVVNDRYSWHRNMLPANFHDPEDVDMGSWKRDGYIYSVIKNGLGNMKGYGAQIGVEDRWAIVAYVRSLEYAYKKQFSQDKSDYKEEIVNILNEIVSIRDKLLSDEFEELVKLDKSDPKNLIQDLFGRNIMIEVQKMIKVDSPIPDGLWGEGSRRKWVKWKKNEMKNDL